MFIFILQGVWLYISELAGKDLDIAITTKFILYYMPKLIPLVVPLTVLLSSIMVFGNFAENYEFAAMKSTGISLQRAMRSLSVFIIALGIGCFFFANNVIPWGEYNFYNLRRNIAKKKPALAIAEGQFNDIGNINIKVEKKSGDNDQYLHNVIIHEKTKTRNGNHTVIVAEKGELKSSPNSNILQLELINGNRYQEIVNKDARKNSDKPHAKSYFDKYIFNVDLEILNADDLEEKNYSDRYNMQDVKQLNYTIDSLHNEKTKHYKSLTKTLYNRTNYPALNLNINTPKTDSLYTGNILDLFTSTSSKIQVLNLASNSSNSTKQILDNNEKTSDGKAILLNKHIIALHDKFVLAIACIILFFVGAPLGALIRKGGLGLPMVIAIVLFLTYHFFGIFAKNSAEKGSFSPIIGSWLSTAVMLPLSIYLTSRATNDKGAFQIDSILEPLKKLFGIKNKQVSISNLEFDTDSNEYKSLLNYDNDKLKSIIKNYNPSDFKIEYKNSAISILDSRGITKQELKLTGNLRNEHYEEALRLKNAYEEDSKLALITYIISTILSIAGRIFENNKFPTLGNTLFVIGIVIFVIFIFSLIKSFSKHSDLYKHLGKQKSINPLLYILLGFPLYFIFYYIQKKQIDDALVSNKNLK
jgi:lipopolysaccharide export system permease protein